MQYGCVEGEEDESIFTKDEQSVRYERIHEMSIIGQTESVLKSVKKCNVVQSIEGCGHIQSSENCNFTEVNRFHDIIC